MAVSRRRKCTGLASGDSSLGLSPLAEDVVSVCSSVNGNSVSGCFKDCREFGGGWFRHTGDESGSLNTIIRTKVSDGAVIASWSERGLWACPEDNIGASL